MAIIQTPFALFVQPKLLLAAAVSSAVRRGIFVESQTKMNFSPPPSSDFGAAGRRGGIVLAGSRHLPKFSAIPENTRKTRPNPENMGLTAENA